MKRKSAYGYHRENEDAPSYEKMLGREKDCSEKPAEINAAGVGRSWLKFNDLSDAQ